MSEIFIYSPDSMSDLWRIPIDIQMNAERTHLGYMFHGIEREILVSDMCQFRQGPLITDRARRSPELLTEFLALADTPAERILAYAQKWGVLELCAHNVPRWHVMPAVGNADRNQGPDYPFGRYPCLNYRWYECKVGIIAEPLDVWRSVAQEARTLWQVTSDLQRGRVPSTRDNFDTLCRMLRHFITSEDIRVYEYYRAYESFDTIQGLAVSAVNHWIQMAGIMPSIYLAGDEAAMTIGGHHLFAELTLRLASALCRGRETVICHDCRIPYVPPGRRPRAGSRHYCPACRAAKIPERDAARDYRERKRQAIEGQP